ncbi:MAG: acyloxyacyl hydrolase [Bacteroidia bacterium]|nr:acyloxyacyl hydrolase [Bacteroidia bacterium]
MKRLFCILIISAALILPGFAQQARNARIMPDQIGFISGWGGQNELGLNVRYVYRVVFYQGQLYYQIGKKKRTSLDLLVQPQFNTTTYRPFDWDMREETGFELGINFGLVGNLHFAHDKAKAYAFLSFGPHYVSGVPNRQSVGFIFSDNLFVGLQLQLVDQLWLDLRPGFRHISNAGLLPKNGGVNNGVLSGGLIWDLP